MPLAGEHLSSMSVPVEAEGVVTVTWQTDSRKEYEAMLYGTRRRKIKPMNYGLLAFLAFLAVLLLIVLL